MLMSLDFSPQPTDSPSHGIIGLMTLSLSPLTSLLPNWY